MSTKLLVWCFLEETQREQIGMLHLSQRVHTVSWNVLNIKDNLQLIFAV